MITIPHLAIIGAGLIGGSLARALRKAGCVERITGIGRGKTNLIEAKKLGIIDHWSHDIAAVADADLVVVATPMGTYDEIFSALTKHARADAIITDIGSTKQHALLMAARHLPPSARFVAAHPIAGTEHSGASASRADLFQNKLLIITPDTTTEARAEAQVKAMWQTVGANVITMQAARHDALMAAVSHLPHIAAFAIVNAVSNQGKHGGDDPLQFAAGGFRDFTRIASSSPDMWRDIALTNRDAMVANIDALTDQLSAIRQAISHGDGQQLTQLFTHAKSARDAWLQQIATTNKGCPIE
ncbi:MAG: prephenate dehydrogenase/arogenate dehydrogenase family protein [Mariprofundales bacterium]